MVEISGIEHILLSVDRTNCILAEPFLFVNYFFTLFLLGRTTPEHRYCDRMKFRPWRHPVSMQSAQIVQYNFNNYIKSLY